MKREEAIRRMECCRNFLANNYSDMGEPNITAFNMAIKALEQEPCTLDDAREDFMFDVYNTLDFLPTNEEANKIIDIFDRVTSGLEQEPILDKIRAEIMDLEEELFHRPNTDYSDYAAVRHCVEIIDKYKDLRRKNDRTAKK